MGFCRRCGDIVIGERCKCGGLSVAPVVQWNTTTSKDEKEDSWSKTYTRERSPVRPSSATSSGTFPSPTSAQSKRFSAPKPFPTSRPLDSRVSTHIKQATETRPIHQRLTSTDDPDTLTSADILTNPHNTSELAKAYGSVLQPAETLAAFRCHICSFAFAPDATIYPDPSAPSLSADSGARFLCKPCFVANGGSKGDCHACQRPVLILKREGGFVETADRVYHKACFKCEGCSQNIGEKPMVDLLGRPSCNDCFDTCLSRPDGSKAVPRTPTRSNNLGGMRAGRSREGSPALEELEHRLGISRNRANSVASIPSSTHSTPQRIPGSRETITSPPRGFADHSSPVRHQESPAPSTGSAVEEMKRRFLRTPTGSPFTTPTKSYDTTTSHSSDSPRYQTPELKTRRSITTLRDYGARKSDIFAASPPPRSNVRSPQQPPFHIPTPERATTRIETQDLVSKGARSITSTPDLMSDWSDTATQSSGLTTPPKDSSLYGGYSSRQSFRSPNLQKTPTKQPEGSDRPESQKPFRSKKSLENLRIPAPLSQESKCARCSIPLFTTNGGKFVTVPEEPSSAGIAPKVYHSDCFVCRVCDKTFGSDDNGRAVFVRTKIGPCHVECAPVEKVNVRPLSTPPVKFSSPMSIDTRTTPSTTASPRPRDYVPPTASATVNSFAFTTAGRCPGCCKSVSPMERGVVPGPQGTRWHATCLVCGGQTAKTRSGRRDPGQPGCGKKLDSAAKVDGEGNVWCRECLLMLSPTKTSSGQFTSPNMANGSFWSSRSNSAGPLLTEQMTGVTTIARQQTGLGSVSSSHSDPALLRQLTGGGLSPTRQLGSQGLPRQHTGGGEETIQRHTTGGGVRSQVTGGRFARPKSVGLPPRHGKSVDEGRGMFLVRQMTGGTGSFQV